MTFKKLYHCLFWFSVLLINNACENSNSQSEQDQHKSDSLSLKLNSPELKKLNADILSDPSNPNLYNQRAKIYWKLNQLIEATADAIRSIRLDSTQVNYYADLADIYFAQNKTKLAKETLEIIEVKFPENEDAQLKLAELYFLVKDYQAAIDHTNKALKINTNLAQAYFLKGNIYRESGDTGKAISNLMTTIEQDNKFAMAYQDLGVIYAAKKNPLAFDFYNNALKLNPNNTEVSYGIAKLLQDLNKIDEAIDSYTKILEKDENCFNCLYNLGAIHFEIKKDNKTALEFFSKTISKNPNYVEAYLARGLTYLNLKDKIAAKADFEMCLRLEPNYQPALLALNQI
ncbi:MAG: tetratricopeptide repeat protein [Sphingobacteriaceae bacterium]|nr:tetratricopeptide repeat protein [Sphingobacteriaceae bacterium]